MIPSAAPVLRRLRRMFKERPSRRQARNLTLYSHEDGQGFRIWGEQLLCIANSLTRICLKACVGRGRIITLIALFTIYFLWIRELRLVETLRYKIGIYSPAALTISILEYSSDENYPKKDLSDDKNSNYYFLKRRNEEEGMFYEDRIIWKVEGFSQYIHNYTDSEDPIKFGRFKKILFENEELDLSNVSGLWIMGYGQLAGVVNKRAVKMQDTSIQALMVTDHFRNNLGIAPDLIEVAVAMRAAVIGEAGFQVRFEDGRSDKYHKENISNERFKGKGFCYYVFNLPFNNYVNSIQIRPMRPDPGKDSNAVVIVDKVIIVVAKTKTAESFLHTIVPQDWC